MSSVGSEFRWEEQAGISKRGSIWESLLREGKRVAGDKDNDE